MATHERVPNPYRPGFNQPPEYLAGRDSVLAAASELLEIAALDRRTPPPLLLVGARGVGKSVLLGEISDLAATRFGWPTVYVEATEGRPITAHIAEQGATVTRLLAETPRKDWNAKAFTMRAGFGLVSADLTVERAGASSTALGVETALSAAMEAARHKDPESGIVLAVDEAHLGSRADLGDLAAVLQRHVPENWPIVAVFAGLPDLRDPGHAVTYFERAEWHDISLLEAGETRDALVRPAEAHGRSYSTAALDLLVPETGGYPYAVQMYGYHAWRQAAGKPEINIAHARAAARTAHERIASNLYARRWADSPPSEKSYLVAAARLAETSPDRTTTNGAIADLLGTTAKRLSTTRSRVLRKGNLVAVGRELRFPVPGMARWINDRTEEGDGP